MGKRKTEKPGRHSMFLKQDNRVTLDSVENEVMTLNESGIGNTSYRLCNVIRNGNDKYTFLLESGGREYPVDAISPNLNLLYDKGLIVQTRFHTQPDKNEDYRVRFRIYNGIPPKESESVIEGLNRIIEEAINNYT